ncbi:MAG: nickel pincer cofactor biosynthesis protein LarC [Clostridia bacterium]|nr:nickel pincer cofactor biosynthesis protein LarC [Clostridia bacterium]
MKALYYDCFAGISGDMNLGAMVDLGVSIEHIKKELSKLGLDGEFEIKLSKGDKHGIFGTKVDVIDLNAKHAHAHDDDHDHHHHTQQSHDHTGMRDYGEIKKIIEISTLDERVKQYSIRIFDEIARAEAHIHNRTMDTVHFHEVGAIDSIVDIVGAAICFDALNVNCIMASKVETGSGFVRCDHGLMPVPAPATAEILKGVPICSKVEKNEMTTPTGAAILKAFVDEFTEDRNFTISEIGYGLGTRNLEIPNLLRVMLIELETHKKTSTEKQWIIESNIDDMSSELLVYAEERLFKSGALDVYKTPIIMKKGRPAIKLSILVQDDRLDEVKKTLFKETTSIGLRMYAVEKQKLDRKFTKVNTSFGDVTLKEAYLDGECVNQKLEYEDCKRIALENEMSIKDVYEIIEAIIAKGKERQ